MCFITVIHRKGQDQKDEFRIRLSSSQLVSLETPYYVVVDEQNNTAQFTYVYSEETSNTSIIQINDVYVACGDYTGRVFYIKTSQTIDLLRPIDTNGLSVDGWTDVKNNNLKLGLHIYNAIIKCLNEASGQGS